MIDTNNLKETIDMEIKQWISVYGKAMQIKYKREMDFIVAQVIDFDRKLDRPINDLDDIRIIMETQKKIRDQEIDMDMKIDLVEEAFALLSKYEIQLTKEEVEKVESLEYIETKRIEHLFILHFMSNYLSMKNMLHLTEYRLLRLFP